MDLWEETMANLEKNILVVEGKQITMPGKFNRFLKKRKYFKD